MTFTRAYVSYAETKLLAEEEVSSEVFDRTTLLTTAQVLAAVDAGLWAVILNPGVIMGKYDLTGFARVARLVAQVKKAMALPLTTHTE